MLRINGSLIKTGNSLLTISGTTPVPGYSRFMLKISGFYTPQMWQNPQRYIQWDEVGVGWNGLGPFYGPDYWSIESFSTTQIYTHVDEEALQRAVDSNPLASFDPEKNSGK